MAERLPGLPDPLVPPVFTADPTGAVVQGRRLRRRRAAALLGGSGAVAASVVAVLVLSGSGRSQAILDPLDTPTAQPSSPTASPSDSAADPSPAAPGPTQPLPSPTTTLVASPPPALPALPGTRTTSTPTATPAPAGAIAGPAYATTAFDASRGCSGSGPSRAQGYCSYYDGATSGARGDVVELAAAVCRLPGLGDGTLRANDGEYATFAITDTEGERWDWRTGKAFVQEGRAFTIAAGSCLRFHVRWDLTDDAGVALPPGVYDLQAYPNLVAEGANVGTAAVQAFRIT